MRSTGSESPPPASARSPLSSAVYAAVQVPVGMLVDRYGYRRIMPTGALAMAARQVALAFASGPAAALAAWLLIGLGDGVMLSAWPG